MDVLNMRLSTTFWSDEVHEFDNLLYVNGKTKEIVFRANLNDVQNTYRFFKNISKFVKSNIVRKTLYDDDVWYQFYVLKDDDLVPIKWFDLIIDEKTTISHDIAFSTTLIKKNGVQVPFGKFPHWYKNWERKKFPAYRELNIKSRAYKYLANKVWNSTQ